MSSSSSASSSGGSKKRKAADAGLDGVTGSTSVSGRQEGRARRPSFLEQTTLVTIPYVRSASEVRWSKMEESSEAMIPIIGGMYRWANTVSETGKETRWRVTS